VSLGSEPELLVCYGIIKAANGPRSPEAQGPREDNYVHAHMNSKCSPVHGQRVIQYILQGAKGLPVLVLSNPCIGEAPALDELTRNESLCTRSITINGPMGLARVKLFCSHDGVDL
jgi:hypothetical protein